MPKSREAAFAWRSVIGAGFALPARCRPEVYTFPGITFSWGRQLANEWRRRGCVGARPVAGGRRPEEEGGAGSELAEPHLAWWRPSRGASPFFLLPAMKLLPAHPRRRRHPEGRSAAEEARSALPSSTWMGTMLSSCRKQENQRFLFSWALRCERYRRALPHQPVSRPAGSNQPEARVLNTYAGLCLDGSLAVIDAQ